MAMLNTTSEVTSGTGVVTGANPMHNALLLVILQIALIIGLSRLITFLLRPLRQPRVVAEIIGGILLGPSAFGRIPGFTQKLFPTSSLVVLDVLANLGLIFFVFLVGLELDMKKIRKTRAPALWMAAAGIILPFGLAVIVSCVIFKVLKGLHSNFGSFTMFIGVALSITAFPVLARILAERKLLTTEIGEIAMSAAAVNDIVAWILLALAVTIPNAGSSPILALWVLALGIAFLAFMFLLVRPIAFAMAQYEEPIPEPIIAFTLVLVLAAALLSDLIGIHVIFGAFICGLIIPNDGPFAAILIEKMEDYVSILFLPLYFASSGLKTNISAMNGSNAVGILAMVLATACLGKVMGTMIVAKVWGMELRKSMALGFLMNTKGLLELIVLNIGLSKGVITPELFAIMVIMAIVTTFITTPIVMWLYNPACDITPYKQRRLDASDKDQLRMLICAHGSQNLPAMIYLAEMTKGKEHKSLRLFLLHLMELSDHCSAIRIGSMDRKGGEIDWREGQSRFDSVEVTFQKYGQLNRMKVKTTTAISPYDNMHEDIWSTATKNQINLVILPFHKYHCHNGSFESMHSGCQHVNEMLLKDSPCSVGIFVDRGFGGHSATIPVIISQHICVLFFGGPDDREAILLACRMSRHSGVKLTVIHCLIRSHVPPHGIFSLPSDTLVTHSPRKCFEDVGHVSAVGKGWEAILGLGRRLYGFFKAPWCKTEEPASFEKNQAGHGNSEATNRKTVGTNGQVPTPLEKGGAVHLEMDILESEDNRKLDMEALAPLLAAAKTMNERESKLVGNNESIDSQFTDPDSEESGPHHTSPNLTVKVWEMDDPYESVKKVASSSEYGLLIVGLHLNSNSPLSHFPAIEEHGLGPIGDLLVSKEVNHMRASVIVIQQHQLSKGQHPVKSLGLPPPSDEVVASAGEKIHPAGGMDAYSQSGPFGFQTSNGIYHTEDGKSRATREQVMCVLTDLGEALSSP